MNTYQKTRNKLENLAEKSYKEFSASLLPKDTNLLGVRLPILRKLANEISKLDWNSYLDVNTNIFEEKLIQAFIIGLVVKNDETIKFIEDFITKIDNWSICDSFCCSLKFTKTNYF